MSNARLFCIGFVVCGCLFSVFRGIGFLTGDAAELYWIAKLVTCLTGGAAVVSVFGDRTPKGGER